MNYALVGAFVLVLGAVLIAGVLWLASGGAYHKKYDLLEGALVRCAVVTDVTLIEPDPDHADAAGQGATLGFPFRQTASALAGEGGVALGIA